MKTNMLIIAALAFSVNAFAQNSPANTNDKMASMNRQNVGNFSVSHINPSWETVTAAKTHYRGATAVMAGDGYKMTGNSMFVVKDGQQTGMLHYTTVKNGYVVLISGAVITNSGKMLFLKDGDSIDMKGLVIRNPVPDNAVAAR